ncbi:MAG: O-antigen ligase family protein [Ilumatobacteraceae bacterium]|nr:O-antigen ligase family protein [Ilumatobacter sp.]MCB0981291.1 O-antigen ligase family protein [Ilumatobacter sp.]MCO5329550.1 O-antigen ligase family protein [Ilumatobacteraceae bacterium]
MTIEATTPSIAVASVKTKRSTPLLLLQIYIWLMAGLPARLVIGSIGSFGSPASLAGLLTFGLWAVSAGKEGTLPRVVWPVRFGLLALWIPTLLSYAIMHLHSNPADEVNGADRALLFLLVWSGAALLTAEGLAGLDELLRLLRTLAVAAAYVSAVAIAQSRFGFDFTLWLAKIPGLSVSGELDSVLNRSGFNRPAGTATHPIELGCVLAIVLGLTIVLAVFDHGWKVRTRWLTLAVIGLGIPLALSRAGILSAAIVLVFWLAGANRKHAMRTLAASAGFVVLLFLTTPGLLGTLKNWFAGWSQDQSISTRTDDYPAVAYYIRRSPIIGRGPSTFLPKFRILDNQWLLQLIEVGVIGAVGFAIYLLLPGFLGRSARHRQPDELWRAMGQALAGSSMVAIVASASFDSFTFPMFPGLWAVVLGAAGLLWRASPAPPLAVTAPSPPHEHAP